MWALWRMTMGVPFPLNSFLQEGKQGCLTMVSPGKGETHPRLRALRDFICVHQGEITGAPCPFWSPTAPEQSCREPGDHRGKVPWDCFFEFHSFQWTKRAVYHEVIAKPHEIFLVAGSLAPGENSADFFKILAHVTVELRIKYLSVLASILQTPELFSLPTHCGPKHCVFWTVEIFILAF